MSIRRVLSTSIWLGPLLVACSSEDGTSGMSETDAGNDDANADADADAGAADAAPPPLPYDFTVSCAGDPCVMQIAARGGAHACAILRDGSVRCWGANASGQLGISASDGGTPYEAAPRRVAGIANATSIATTGRDISGTTCVVSGDGEVSCFGSDAWGQLGRGAAPSIGPHPDPLPLPGLRAKAVTLAETFALALGTDDRLWSWGSNDHEQLARELPDSGPEDAGPNPSTTPAPADRITVATRSFGGTAANGFVVTGEGQVLSWGGSRTSEQLGRASSILVDPTPLSVALANATSVATGAAHACALTSGSVHCWGQNDHGQLGTTVQAPSLFPTAVVLPENVHPVAVAAGGNNTCILASKGEIYCWGANGSGQLGTAPGHDQATAEHIASIEGEAVAVAVMDEAACALMRTGSVVCWGDNLVGQLGRGARDVEVHLEAAPVVFE